MTNIASRLRKAVPEAKDKEYLKDETYKKASSFAACCG